MQKCRNAENDQSALGEDIRNARYDNAKPKVLLPVDLLPLTLKLPTVAAAS